jgi:GT2 family glycosyltransferase
MDRLEVLVVDDGSTDDTSETIRSMSERAPYRLRYLRHENRGPGYSQNRGLREAQNDLVLIMPDDVLPTPELPAAHVALHRENPGDHVAVLGKVLQSPDLPQTAFQRNWDPFRFDLFDGRDELDPVFFFACNLSVKRHFLLENGVFVERRGAAHEDVELGYRLGQRGLRLLYSERALAHHHHAETLSSACRRSYERGLNFDLLRDALPASVVFPMYHILSPEAGWRAYLKMLPRELLRAALFNRLTVSVFWMPLLERADRSRLAALMASNLSVRGTVYFHLRQGYRESCRRRSVSCVRTHRVDA